MKEYTLLLKKNNSNRGGRDIINGRQEEGNAMSNRRQGKGRDRSCNRDERNYKQEKD